MKRVRRVNIICGVGRRRIVFSQATTNTSPGLLRVSYFERYKPYRRRRYNVEAVPTLVRRIANAGGVHEANFMVFRSLVPSSCPIAPKGDFHFRAVITRRLHGLHHVVCAYTGGRDLLTVRMLRVNVGGRLVTLQGRRLPFQSYRLCLVPLVHASIESVLILAQVRQVNADAPHSATIFESVL